MSENSKIKRNAFIYLEPSEKSYGDPKQFAQCGTCALWTGEKRKRCYILGKKLEVLAGDTCGLYCNGEPQVDLLTGNEIETMKPEDAAFYKGQVRCENCLYFNSTISSCKLFFILDSEFPNDFDLGSGVKATGCCNANIPNKFKGNKKDAIGQYLKKVLNKEVNLDNLF